MAQAGGREVEKIDDALQGGPSGDRSGARRLTALRVLALDYGSARCGCAVSDPTETIAIPIDAITRPDSRRGMASLIALVAEREVDRWW